MPPLHSGSCDTCADEGVKLRTNPFDHTEQCENCRTESIIGITDIKTNYKLKDEDLKGLHEITEPKPAFLGGPDYRWYLVSDIVARVAQKAEREQAANIEKEEAEKLKEAAKIEKEEAKRARESEKQAAKIEKEEAKRAKESEKQAAKQAKEAAKIEKANSRDEQEEKPDTPKNTKRKRTAAPEPDADEEEEKHVAKRGRPKKAASGEPVEKVVSKEKAVPKAKGAPKEKTAPKEEVPTKEAKMPKAASKGPSNKAAKTETKESDAPKRGRGRPPKAK